MQNPINHGLLENPTCHSKLQGRCASLFICGMVRYEFSAFSVSFSFDFSQMWCLTAGSSKWISLSNNNGRDDRPGDSDGRVQLRAWSDWALAEGKQEVTCHKHEHEKQDCYSQPKSENTDKGVCTWTGYQLEQLISWKHNFAISACDSHSSTTCNWILLSSCVQL